MAIIVDYQFQYEVTFKNDTITHEHTLHSKLSALSEKIIISAINAELTHSLPNQTDKKIYFFIKEGATFQLKQNFLGVGEIKGTENASFEE